MPRGIPGSGKAALKKQKEAENLRVLRGGGNAVPKSEIEGLNPQEMAEKIAEISNGVNKLLNGGLKFETIVLLLHDATKLPRTDIKTILRTLPQLKELYVEG